jgi:hypothetical protein
MVGQDAAAADDRCARASNTCEIPQVDFGTGENGVGITNPWTLRSPLVIAVVRLAVPPPSTSSSPPLTVVALARPPKKTSNSPKLLTVVEIATPPLTNKLPKSTIVVCSVVPPE